MSAVLDYITQIECATDGAKDDAWLTIVGVDHGGLHAQVHVRAQALFSALSDVQLALLSAHEDGSGIVITCYVVRQ